MTDSPIRALADLLVDRLAEPAATEDDFVRLATAGEPLRRSVALADTVSTDVAELVDKYEAALAGFRGDAPTTLVDDAIAIASDVDSYVNRCEEDEDGLEALDLVLELDAIVSTAVAAERTGRLPRGTTDTLAARLEQALAGVSYRSPKLAQIAEDRWLTVGDDPELIGAYGWLDVLAEAAPSRARIDGVVKDAASRERRIDQAMEILARRRPGERLSRSVTQLPVSVTAPRVQHAHFAATEATVPEQTPLFENEDLSVFLEETRTGLHLVVAFAPPFWLDDVRGSIDGVALARAAGGRHEFRFVLPDRGGRLRLELQIGDDVVSHEIDLRRPT